MKPIKSTRLGARKGDFDYLYGEYKSLEEALKILEHKATLGQQFAVINEEGEVDLYLWQGKGHEPTLITEEHEEGTSVSGDYIPLKGTEEGKNISGEFQIESDFKLKRGDFDVFSSEGSSTMVGGYDYVDNLEYHTYLSRTQQGNILRAFRRDYDRVLPNIDNEFIVGLEGIQAKELSEDGYSVPFIARNPSDVITKAYLTPSVLKEILQSATSAELQEIKDLLK